MEMPVGYVCGWGRLSVIGSDFVKDHFPVSPENCRRKFRHKIVEENKFPRWQRLRDKNQFTKH